MEPRVECENGEYGHWTTDCPNTCGYYDSCRYITGAPDPDSSRRTRNAVSFEKIGAKVAIPDPTTDPEAPAPQTVDKTLTSLADILNYLVHLDDNTVATICELIRNPSLRQAELARKRGVSRQRINTSLLYICRAHPELAQLFCLCVKRITIAKNRYKREKSGISASRPDQPSLL